MRCDPHRGVLREVDIGPAVKAVDRDLGAIVGPPNADLDRLAAKVRETIAANVRAVDDLAVLYARTGRGAEAERLVRETLATREKVFVDHHPEIADGRLTVSNAPGSVNNKIAFIDINTIAATSARSCFAS